LLFKMAFFGDIVPKWAKRKFTLSCPCYFATYKKFSWLFPPHLHLKKGQMPVAHACNPSYSGGRDQEDLGFKASLGK
jgi:hypothetical protein